MCNIGKIEELSEMEGLPIKIRNKDIESLFL